MNQCLLILFVGSSVATSLSPGETQIKRVGLLEIRNKQFRLTPIPLKQVRSFVMGDISLGNLQDENEALDPEDPNIEEEINDLLVHRVEALIEEAAEKSVALLQEISDTRGEDQYLQELERQTKYKVQKPDLVLVRLKVEHHGFSTLNNQRFGSRFIEKVSNLSDILLFHRKRRLAVENVEASKDTKARLSVPLAPEELENTNVEELINDDLDQGNKKLELFDQSAMGNALTDFVDKQTTHAFEEATLKLLNNQQKKLIKRGKVAGTSETIITSAAGVREVCKYESQKNGHQQASRTDHSIVNDEVDGTIDKNDKNKVWNKSQSQAKKRSLLRESPRNTNDTDNSDDNASEYYTKVRSRKSIAIPKSIERKATSSTIRREEDNLTPTRSQKSRMNRNFGPKASDDEIETSEDEVKRLKSSTRTKRHRVSATKSQFSKYAYSDDDTLEEVTPKKYVRKSSTSRGTKRTRAKLADSMSQSNSDVKKRTRQVQLSFSTNSQMSSEHGASAVKRKNLTTTGARSSRSTRKLSAYQVESEDDISVEVIGESVNAASELTNGWGSSSVVAKIAKTRASSKRRTGRL